MMTNEKLTAEVIELKARMINLENHCGVNEQPIEPPVPVPPVNPPMPPEKDIIDIDMSVARHYDVPIGAGKSQIFRFEFSGGVPGMNAYTQFTAVQPFSSDGCFAMFIPEYGYGNEKCRYEISNGVGTDSEHTSWVVPMNEEILLYVDNAGGKTTLRLKCNGENPY